MNYVEYTNQVIRNYANDRNRIVVFGPGYNLKSSKSEFTNEIYCPEHGEDICDWCDYYLMSDDFELADLVIMSRVLEHIESRYMDYYLYCISKIMKTDAILHVVVPDMAEVVNRLNFESQQPVPDYRKIMRLNNELFSEGGNTRDRHATFMCERSVINYITMERLFGIVNVRKIHVHTEDVPKEIEVVARKI